MEINSFRKLVDERKQKEEEIFLNKSVATAIKRKRKELNYTQEQAAKGICSISYLSKIENGYLEPDNYYVQEIMNRIGIAPEEISSSNYLSELRQIIKAISYGDSDIVLRIYNNVLEEEPQNTLSAELVFLAKEIFFKKLNKATQLIKLINGVKKDLYDYELKVFMYLIAKYEVMRFDNMLALKYIRILERIESEDTYLEIEILTIKLEASIAVGNYVVALNTANIIENVITPQLNFQRLLRVRLSNALLLILSGQVFDGEYLLKTIKRHRGLNSEILERFWYVEGWLFKSKADYDRAIESFNKITNELYLDSLINVIECYSLKGDKTNLAETRKIISEIDVNQNRSFYLRIAEYFHIRTTDNQYKLKDFINMQILPMMKNNTNWYYFELAINELIEFHRGNGRYKETDKLYKKLAKGFQ